MKEGAAGTTPEEVAAAVGLAERMMQREGISRAMLEVEGKAAPEVDELIKNFHDPLDRAKGKKLDRWRGMLAVIVGRAHGCEVYQSGPSLGLIGRPSDAEVVRYLYEHCAREIERLADDHCRGERRTFANNFRIGCVEAIHTVIKREHEAARAEERAAATTSSALVVVNQAIALLDVRAKQAAKWGKVHMKLRSGSSSLIRGDATARAMGRAAGAGIYGSAKPGIDGSGRVAGRIGGSK